MTPEDIFASGLRRLQQAVEDPHSLYSAARQLTSSVSQSISTLARGSMHHTPSVTVTQLIEEAGLRAEEHSVTTEDGYILQLHRVGAGTGPVVFLQHGLLCSSAAWVIGARDKALGFLLADAGYDVWLGNFRGNTYSRRHTSLDPAAQPFWRFTFDEMGRHDLPTMLDYVLEVTSSSRLVYIGHSMGTMAFWIMMNLRPWMNSKVKLMVGLAPVAAATIHPLSPLTAMAPVAGQLTTGLDFLGQYEFLAKDSLVTDLKDKLWSKVSSLVTGDAHLNTQNALFAIAGCPQADPENLAIVVAHEPSGTSSRNLHHFGQCVTSGVFRAYRFRTEEENMATYGLVEPPRYDLEMVTCPVMLYWGDSDWLAQPRGVATIAAQLPTLVESVRVDHGGFNHLDFLWGKDSVPLLYNQLLEVISHFSPSSYGRPALTN